MAGVMPLQQNLDALLQHYAWITQVAVLTLVISSLHAVSVKTIYALWPLFLHQHCLGFDKAQFVCEMR